MSLCKNIDTIISAFIKPSIKALLKIIILLFYTKLIFIRIYLNFIKISVKNLQYERHIFNSIKTIKVIGIIRLAKKSTK